jgi:hypothetical protein
MNKMIFIPKVPIDVSVVAERKHGPHLFHPYIYTITFKHDNYEWKVVRSYKDLKDCHKVLAKEVKMDIGQSCSDISKFVFLVLSKFFRYLFFILEVILNLIGLCFQPNMTI